MGRRWRSVCSVVAAMLVTAVFVATPRVAHAAPIATVAVQGSDRALWVETGGVWQSYGGQMIGAPAQASFGGATYYVVTGTDHALWVRSDALSWQHIGTGSERCLDSPAAAVAGTTLTVACAGPDDALWYAQAALVPGTLPVLGAWSGLGGSLIAGPAVAVVEGQITFAVTGRDHQVFLRTAASGYVATAWSCIGHPALASSGSQAFFACHGVDDAAWYAQDAGGGWSAAASAGGRAVAGVNLVESGSGADLAVEGIDHGVYVDQIPAGGAATGYLSIGGTVNSGGVGGAVTIIPPPLLPFPAGDAFNNPGCQVPGNSLPRQGKVIILSIACQVMTAYQDGVPAITSLTTTGRPARPTPRGRFSVVGKNHPWQMVSGDSFSSPYWYPPTWVQFVVWFTYQGHGFHDAAWEPNSALGPGSQYNGTIASHGCVHIDSNLAGALYYWADLGTPVLVF